MLFKILLLVALVAVVWLLRGKQEKKRSALRSLVQPLNLHQSCGLNDLAVSAFCNRLGAGQANVAALLEIIAVTRSHIAALERRLPGEMAEAAISKAFFEDAKRIYKTTNEEQALLKGLQPYIYNESVSPEETADLKQRLTAMEAAFGKPAK